MKHVDALVSIGADLVRERKKGTHFPTYIPRVPDIFSKPYILYNVFFLYSYMSIHVHICCAIDIAEGKVGSSEKLDLLSIALNAQKSAGDVFRYAPDLVNLIVYIYVCVCVFE